MQKFAVILSLLFDYTPELHLMQTAMLSTERILSYLDCPHRKCLISIGGTDHLISISLIAERDITNMFDGN